MSNTGQINNVPFQDEVSSPSIGLELTIQPEWNALAVEISGDATSSLCLFEKQIIEGGEWYPIRGFSDVTFSSATQTSGIYEAWDFDLTAVLKIRFNIDSVSGGSITVKGRVTS